MATRAAGWFCAGTSGCMLGLSVRLWNRHHDAVGVAVESRAGWIVADAWAGAAGLWLVGGRLRDAELGGFAGFVPNAYPNIAFQMAFDALRGIVFSSPEARAGQSRSWSRARNMRSPSTWTAGFRWPQRWSASGELMPADGRSGLLAPRLEGARS